MQLIATYDHLARMVVLLNHYAMLEFTYDSQIENPAIVGSLGDLSLNEMWIPGTRPWGKNITAVRKCPPLSNPQGKETQSWLVKFSFFFSF